MSADVLPADAGTPARADASLCGTWHTDGDGRVRSWSRIDPVNAAGAAAASREGAAARFRAEAAAAGVGEAERRMRAWHRLRAYRTGEFQVTSAPTHAAGYEVRWGHSKRRVAEERAANADWAATRNRARDISRARSGPVAASSASQYAAARRHARYWGRFPIDAC
eukprot:TRINITY_DN23963_c0_g1_i1.p1 TRINITY_DN23963_c0_g1~~TRINITY_DN23963_c0_g1_i1.p1  ORF type:complete len:166 (+),score=0.97 TRINITY_DN23963_c0_g1_i1:43-540(+)